jgi:diguanylate cyclase (GGDEF)-like protein
MTLLHLKLPSGASPLRWRAWTTTRLTTPTTSTTAPSGTSFTSWTGWLLAAMAATVLLYAVDLLFHPLPPDLSQLLQNFASGSIFLGAALLCVMKGRAASDSARSAWWLFALAMALYGSGTIYYNVAYRINANVPYPSAADGLWLAFYPPAYAALYLLLRRRSGSTTRGVWLDALVGGLGVGGAVAALVLHRVLENTDGTALTIATNLAYPVGDLSLLALVVAALTVTGWKGSSEWRWIAGALGIFAVADSIYLIKVAAGTFASGTIVDLGWPLAALLLGIAALQAESRVDRSERTRATIAVPAVFGCAALALLAVDHYFPTNPLALGLATATLLVILVRLYLTVRENTGLLAHSRREAATDSLTGLSNRRQLSADLAASIEDLDPERPLMLTFFDLDGFKLYNDTFGHVAGDQLLERLGRRLSAVLDGHGVAYRTGGDEFCALWNRSDIGQASVLTMEAVAALSERGEAFSIGCSYGSVLLPNETTEPIKAEQIADRRMYVRKGGARTSAGRQSSDVLLRALTERNAELGVHLGGVAEWACATAVQLGVPAEQMEAVRQTALLHDVGKVAIPDEILNKPGPLDESEWEFMNRHTLIGERIISAAPALAVVAKSVRSTHERYGGGGYPDGLTGDETPLIARIVAVCDAYDAMLTERPYRHARDRSEAIAELRLCSETQFDPEVVEAFVSVLGKSPGGTPAHMFGQGEIGAGALATRPKPAGKERATV